MAIKPGYKWRNFFLRLPLPGDSDPGGDIDFFSCKMHMGSLVWLQRGPRTRNRNRIILGSQFNVYFNPLKSMDPQNRNWCPNTDPACRVSDPDILIRSGSGFYSGRIVSGQSIRISREK